MIRLSTDPPRRLVAWSATIGISLAVVAGCSGSSKRFPAGARARRIENGDLLPSGPAATAAPGDYVLENEFSRYVIQDATPSPWIIGTGGGHLVDAVAGPSSAAGDDGEFLKVVVPLVAFEIQSPSQVSIPSGLPPGEAAVRVEGSVTPFGFIPPFVPVGRDVELELTTDYVLRDDSPALEVTTHVTNTGRSLGDNATLMDLVLLGAESRDLIGGKSEDGTDVAAELPYFASRTPRAALAVTTAGTIPGTFDISGFRPILYATGPLFAGGEVSYTRYWIAGRDLAGVLREVYRIRGIAVGTIHGTVSGAAAGDSQPPLVSIVDDASNQLVSETYADATGGFTVDVPPGTYQLRASSDQDGVAGDPVRADVSAAEQAEVSVALPGSSTIAVHVHDDVGTPLPAVVEIDGPVSERLATASGSVAFAVPPGHYHVTAMRGPEYSLAESDFDVSLDADPIPLELVLTREVDTTGWLSADFHLHCARSSDSTLPLGDRVTSVAANGLEWVVSSDHDQVTDYAPVAGRLGLDRWVLPTTGDEISTTSYGHFNVFPLVPSASQAGRGAIDWWFRDPATLFSAAASAAPNGLLQLNHPRMDRFGGYLESIGYDPSTGRATRSPSDVGFPSARDLPIDRFQAMEVWNDIDLEHSEDAYRDWVSFQNLGLAPTMTGNSDSHSLGRVSGFPRNFVRAATDDPARASLDELVSAVRGGRVSVSGGLFLTIALADGSEIGSLARHAAGAVDVAVTLRAPSWIDATGVEVLVNGRVAARADVPASREPNRYAGTLAVTIDGDSWIAARAWGERPAVPWKNSTPFAATNPIWIDVDGNGRFDPPGLGTSSARR